MSKIPFLDKFTSSISSDDYDDLFDDDKDERLDDTRTNNENNLSEKRNTTSLENMDTDEGELSVDVYQTDNEIVLRALVAGVLPSNIDISLTRDMITIRGTREENKEVESDNYFYQELYWGSFSRTVLLPEEVEVDEAVATEKHGILTIRLPKVNKSRKTKLKVKSR